MIFDTKKDKARFLVQQALEKYPVENCPSAGYNIIRYTKLGWIFIDESVSPNIFTSW